MSALGALHDHGEDGLAVLAFKIQAQQFDLNRDLKFISMKDQLIRGRTLVLAARQAGLIGPTMRSASDEANVIVIGAGIGGVSAALMACELGLSAKLVEASAECFPLLGLGSDRLFSATAYDWPHAHSGRHAFPYIVSLRDNATAAQLRVQAARLQFPPIAETSQALRALFISQLQQYQTTFGAALDVLCKHRLASMDDVAVNATSKAVFVDLQGPAGPRRLRGQIVIFALGFGLDKDSQQTLAAKEFFSYQGLKADIAKAQVKSGGGLVRIVGAGDGGLQEALRFVLDDAWHDLHRCVSELEKKMEAAGNGAFWLQLCSRLQSAEDQALRSLMWGYTDERIYCELDALYQREMTELLAVAPGPVAQWHAVVVRKAALKVQLVDSSTYSMKTYGLNRWLTGLLERCAAAGSRHATLERVTPANAYGTPDVELTRKGFAAGTKQPQVGTADENDLLRRIAFQGIPMNLDAVV